MSFKGSKIAISEASPGPIRPHQYTASRQKWATTLFYFIWMAGRCKEFLLTK
jgi:hypothetical protein